VNIEKAIAKQLVERVSFSFESDVERSSFIDRLADTIRRRCGAPIHPSTNESLSLSVMRPKTAALAFDRVYRIPVLNEPVPTEVGFYGATPPEIAYSAAALMILASEDAGFTIQGFHDVPATRTPAENERRTLFALCSDLATQYGRLPTIFFHNQKAREAEMPSGSHFVLFTAIIDIALVDEASLSWEQVIEFRKDAEARTKYRRLVRWIDTELQSHSPSEVGDLVAFRLDDYEWALRKHGISTLLGSISSLLDPKFIGAASAVVAATTLSSEKQWGALMGLSIAVGKAAVTFGTTKLAAIQERRANNYEVAYIHEIKSKLSP
jgi:hypothetical protein